MDKINEAAKNFYTKLVRVHQDSPLSCSWTHEAQLFRWKKLVELSEIRENKTGLPRVLDFGCGVGDFLGFLCDEKIDVQYTGMDIVPEMIDIAKKKYPEASFLCGDIMDMTLDEKWDYTLICGVFNMRMGNDDESMENMQRILKLLWKSTNRLTFNFISTYVNYREEAMAYYNPFSVMDWCMKNLGNLISRLFKHTTLEMPCHI